MKKQLRIILFAAMLVLLLGMTMLVVSADNFTVYPTEDDAVAGTNGTAKSTLKDAIEYVKINASDDRYVIKLNNDISITSNDGYPIDIDVKHGFKLDGGSHTITMGSTFTNGFWKIYNDVTIQNLTITRNNDNAYLYKVDSSNTFVLDSVRAGQRSHDGRRPHF